VIDKECTFVLGAQDPEMREIERFMQEHRTAGRAVYGNPYRGYAGTYFAGISPSRAFNQE
jgi:hypothetical protein